MNSDRCFPLVATMPVLDPVGSLAPVNQGGKLQFPEKSSVAADAHVNTFQFPTSFKYDEVDRVYLNSCYNGYPAGPTMYNNNNFDFVLDPSTKDGSENNYDTDLYGKLLNNFGKFVAGSLADDSDYDDANDIQLNSTFNPRVSIWAGLDKLDASQVVLNKNVIIGGPEVTLKDFSDYYGLFDGIDNDGDGVADYKWQDKNNDGVYETRFFDFKEANPVYGIPSWNVQEIARKMLSHKAVYVVPFGVSSFPYSKFDEDIVLKVDPDVFSEIPSTIIHNEPTDYTLSEQYKSNTAVSLPIDNPRYIYFQSEELPAIPYPEPKPINAQINVEAITQYLYKESPYYPGKEFHVDYVNLFADDVQNSAQLQVKIDKKAEELALIPGSYKVFGANAKATDYTAAKIKKEILEKYLSPAVSGITDDPPGGFEIKSASSKKIYDALKWINLNIDEKHEYILKSYLDPSVNAYVNDATNFPKPAGEAEAGYGYEATYLVLDGEKNYFDMNFNKDLPEELDVKFDPIAEIEAASNEGGAGGAGGAGGGSGAVKEDEDFEFVPLSEFLKEMKKFINSFTTVPKFVDTCSYSEEDELADDESKSGLVKAQLKQLKIEVPQTTVNSKEGGKYSVKISALTDTGELYTDSAFIKLSIDQDEKNPPFKLADSNEKTLVAGSAIFNLTKTGNQGSVVFSASSSENPSANPLQVIVTGKELQLSTYTYNKLEGFDELTAAIEKDKAEVDAGGGGGGGGDEVKGGGDEVVGEGSGEGSGEVGGAGSDGDGSVGDGVGGEVVGEGSAGDGASGEVGGGISDSGSYGGDLGNIISDLEKPGVGITENSIPGDENSSNASSSDSDNSAGDNVDKPVDSTDADGEKIPPSEQLDDAEESDADTDVSKELAESEELAESDVLEPQLTWKSYFIQNKYYEKFRESESELESSMNGKRLFASIANDRPIALIDDKNNPFVDAKTNPESSYVVQTNNSFVADGNSLMEVSVQIFNEEEQLISDLDRKVKFSIKDISVGLPPEKILSFENGNISQIKDSSAKVYLRAGTKTGQFKLIAELLQDDSVTVDKSYPPVEEELYLEAGEPTFVDIKSDSYVLVANNQSKTNVSFILKDKYGNVAENAFNLVSVFTDSNVHINAKDDINKKVLGTQMVTFDGKASADLFAEDEAGSAKVIVVLMDYDLEEILLEKDFSEIDFSQYIGNTKTFEVYDKVSLESTILDENFTKINSIVADGSSIARLGVNLVHNGKVVDQYSGPINFKLPNENFGKFINPPASNMNFGELNPANVSFRSSNLAGPVEVLVDVPGFVSDTVKFKTVPGVAKKIQLSSSKDFVNTNSQDEVIIQASLLDENDNLVESNTGTVTNFKASDATKNLVNFNPANAVSLNGLAATKVKGKDIFGKVNISASAPNLEGGTLSLDINKHITSNVVSDFNTRSLYVSLLGGAFGNISNKYNLAQTMLYSGQVEAISSVSATPDDKQRLAVIDAYGQIGILNETMESSVIPATDSFPYQKILFSDILNDKEVAETFMVPKIDTPLLLLEQDAPLQGDAIYVRNLLPEDKSLLIEKLDDGIYAKSGEDTKFRIDKFGRISINDNIYKLSLPANNEEFNSGDLTFIIKKGEEPVAAVIFRQKFNKNVQQILYDDNGNSFSPGLFVKLKSASKIYDFLPAYSRISSNDSMGAYLVNTEGKIDQSQSPGSSFASLEKARSNFGLGFEGDNKHMLLFAAGNSVGESNMPYSSEAGLIFGDPMIKLDTEDMASTATGYTKDIGKPIFTGDEEISQLIDFDFNGDGFDDLLLAYDDGLVRLLENKISNQRFIDRGYVLNVENGILSITKIDVNNDGFDDLLIGTQEGCKEKEQCLSLFTNKDGHFTRKSLDLSLNGKKVYEVKSADMNADGCQDVVLSDSAGDIAIHYNKKEDGQCKGLENNRGNTWNFGFSINPNANLADNIFVNYPGMETMTDENSYKFVEFVLQSNQPNPESAGFAADAQDLQAGLQTNPNIASADVPPLSYPKNYDFVHLKQDSKLIQSTKTATDLNQGNVALGDKIEYMIILKNGGGSSINNLILSDTTSSAMTLDLDSLKCLDAACTDSLEWLDTGLSSRSHVVKNINIPAGGTRTFRYTMTVKTVSKVSFDIGNDFAKYPSNNNDGYKDILVKPEINPSGKLTYLYSSGPQTYKKFELDTNDIVDEKEDGMTSKDLANNAPGTMSTAVKSGLDAIQNTQNQDSDADGCIDSIGGLIDSANDFAGAVSNKVEGALSALRCSGGGCAPIPYNKAFLVPDGVTAGTALFAAGTLNPPYFGFAVPSTLYSTFRLYLSPTLTLGLGTAVCTGPSIGHASPCFAFAIPGGIPGVCQGLNAVGDKVGKLANKAISKAKNSVVDTESGMTTIVSDGSATQASAKDVNLGGSWSDPSDPISANTSVNAKIPGFPSVITNWMDNQTDEIYNKLLDFPTFFLILPDFSPWQNSLKNFDVNSSGSTWQNMHDFATSISRLPMVQIESREILIKVPSVSPKQIAKYNQQWENWIKNLETQLNDRLAIWNCNESEGRKTICDKITADTHKLISSARKVMDTLDQISNLPKEILQWRYAEAKYATQIICYLNAVMNFTGGYIKRQQKIVDSWFKAIQDAIRTFKNWKVVLDVMADYQKSCDQCKNDRFSKLNILLKIFAAIPEPPVIPLPKWPDIVVDLSQIRTGVKIIWPDVVFRPEPIVLPDLPDIRLPELIPDVSLNLDLLEFDFNPPDFSAFSMPNLPDLPALPLPQLPDLPKPPKIPSLDNKVASLAKSLKVIFKLLCLLKKGLIPVPEGTLATEIETLTQPSVQAVLPIITNLAVQWPAIQYDYVQEIRVTAKLNFNINTNVVYQVAKEGADVWNKNLKTVVGKFNTFATLPTTVLVNFFNKLDEESKKAIEDSLINNNESAIPLAYEDLNYEENAPIINNVKSEFEDIQKELDDYIATLEIEQNIPDKYYLTATETVLDPLHPLLNQSLDQAISDLKIEDLPDTPEMQQLVALRSSLIDHAQGIYDSNDVLKNIDDMNSFGKILVDSNQNKVASINYETDLSSNGGGTFETSLFGSAFEKMIKNAADTPEVNRKLAAEINVNVNDYVNNNQESDTLAIGFFITSPDGSVNENVMRYTPALKKKMHIIYSDVDKDSDTDIIYSSGGEIYLKENHKKKADLPKGDLIIGLNNNEVSDYNVKGADSVQGLKSTGVNNKKAELNWKAQKDAEYYEIILRNSVNDAEADYVYKFKAGFKEEDGFLLIFDKENPRVSLEIENGYYITTIYGVDADGNRSLSSDAAIVAPQICADKEAPLPAISSSSMEVPIFKELTLDASGSFDTNGEVSEYYIETLPYKNGEMKITQLQKIIWSDLNVFEDSNGDGVIWNDRSNPVFKIGPFVNEGDIGKHEMLLHVADQSGNTSSLKISVNVIAPDISLNETFANDSVASGKVDLLTSDIPLSLMRKRYIYRVIDGELKLVERLGKIKDAKTDKSGNYKVSDFKLENMILVENSDGVIVAEIHPETGNIEIIKSGYSTLVHQAMPPDTSTSVDVINNNGDKLATVYIVSDENIDVSIHKEATFTADNYKSLRGANVNDVNISDDFEFFSRPANDPKNPGAAVLTDKKNKEALVIIDTAGNILLANKGVTLVKKKNDHTKDPLVIEIKFKGLVIGEVYVSAFNALIVGPNDVPYSSPRTPTSGTLYPFDSIDSIYKTGAGTDLKKILNDLYKSDSSLGLQAGDAVQRDQFVRVLLNMLCIIPRPEAYDPGIKYSDGDNLGEHYAYIKEATLLGLIEGYKGEPDANGLIPFKPNATISRAEAVKIILEALEMKNVVNLSELKEGEPWYNSYMSAAQNLTPYLNEGYFLQNNFIISPEESLDPEKPMTFEELTTMVDRVLSIYNCFDIDANGNGMSDFCELKYGVTDPALDMDLDGLTNLEECSFGLDPGDKDSDGGGVPDGDEIKMLSNPFNPDDDKPTNDFGADCSEGSIECKEGEAGIYIVPAECNTCPCISTLLYKADLVPGDVFFPIISVDYEDRTHIFSKGNEVSIQSVNSKK